jgi:hypothetical protein
MTNQDPGPASAASQKLELRQSSGYHQINANNGAMRGTTWDFLLHFGKIVSASGNVLTVKTESGVFLSSQQAKALLKSLSAGDAEYAVMAPHQVIYECRWCPAILLLATAFDNSTSGRTYEATPCIVLCFAGLHAGRPDLDQQPNANDPRPVIELSVHYEQIPIQSLENPAALIAEARAENQARFPKVSDTSIELGKSQNPHP